MDPRLERKVLNHIYRNRILDPEDRRSLESTARRKGLSPVNYILAQGYVPDLEMARIMGKVVNLPVRHLEDVPDNPEDMAYLIPMSIARKFHVAPIEKRDGKITIGVAEPLPLAVLNNLARVTKSRIRPVIVPREDVRRWLKIIYRIEVEEEKIDSGPEEVEVGEDLIRAIDDILRQALDERSSDIHFEPMEDRMRVRFRVDGMLREKALFSSEYVIQVIARIKVLANLDIAEKREAQDGGFTFEAPEEPVDVRVSILPTIHGEKAVLRLLMGGKADITLKKLGMEPDTLETAGKLIRRPYGIILVTGPTGSGKSTTLYAALSMVKDVSVNISTIEDPVEYQIEGVTQTQVDSAHKVTFSKALRSLLRQDPDIIMVGEIRDMETAEIALRAAMTGHLVFATLHTNDAPSSITRLLDMGCEPFLVASSVVGVLAQRLVRQVCPQCKKAYTPDEIEVRSLGVPDDDIGRQRTWYGPVGCPRCAQTGYRGRMGIFELMPVSRELRTGVVTGASFEEIRQIAMKDGMRTLRQDAILKVDQGLTTVHEAMRVTITD